MIFGLAKYGEKLKEDGHSLHTNLTKLLNKCES